MRILHTFIINQQECQNEENGADDVEVAFQDNLSQQLDIARRASIRPLSIQIFLLQTYFNAANWSCNLTRNKSWMHADDLSFTHALDFIVFLLW